MRATADEVKIERERLRVLCGGQSVAKRPAAAAGPPRPAAKAKASSIRKCSICGKAGHRLETCPHRTEPLKAKGARGSSQPAAYSHPYSHAPTGGKLVAKRGNVHRTLKDEPDYPDIVFLSEEGSEAALGGYGFLHLQPPGYTILTFPICC